MATFKRLTYSDPDIGTDAYINLDAVHMLEVFPADDTEPERTRLWFSFHEDSDTLEKDDYVEVKETPAQILE